MTEGSGLGLDIIKQAMQLEQEGREFYLKAAQTTQDEKGQQMFRTLASDEKNHFDLLQRQYNALKQDERWMEFPEIKRTQLDWDKPLFPKGKEALEKAVTAKSSELDALLFGLDIENRSHDLYRRAAVETADAPGKAMFEFLAGEERGHFDILMMRYQYLASPSGW